MSVIATCACGSTFKAIPELAGKVVNCPSCGQTLQVPDLTTAADPIRVVCQCGKAFKAKPELAGKRVKSPCCSQPLTIPHPQLAAIEGTSQTSSASPGNDALEDDIRLAPIADAPKPATHIAPMAKAPAPTSNKVEVAVDGKTIAVISYVTIVGWVIAFVLHQQSSPRSPLAAFHLRQSLGLIVAGIIFSIVLVPVVIFVPFLGAVVGLLNMVMSLAMFAHWIYGVVSAAKGEQDYLIGFFGELFDSAFEGLFQ